MSATHQARGSAAAFPRILCVDDEPAVLESLCDTLHRHFDVWTATSGASGLDQLRAEPLEFAVVISDMRMPVMPGHVFLHEACKLAPDATRMVLTGYADVDAAISAVNDGQLFRFLTKPCSPTDLLASCQAALEQHRLRTAEKVLLEQTLKGSLKALSDVLALANPAAFGRSASVREHAQRLAVALDAGTTWEVEVAAMLAQLGAITLPPATAEKLYSGANLIPREQEMVARVPELTRQILANIPRLEGVLEILDNYPRSYGAMGAGRSLPIGARIVRIAIDYDALEARGYASDVALATLRGRAKAYDPDLLALLETVVGTDTRDVRVTEIPLLALRAGMMLVDDVRSVAGALLIARGHVATEQLVTRLWNLGEGHVREPLLVAEAPPAVWTLRRHDDVACRRSRGGVGCLLGELAPLIELPPDSELLDVRIVEQWWWGWAVGVLLRFVGERLGDLHGGDGIEHGTWRGEWVVVVRDGFDDAVRESPEGEQVRAGRGVGDALRFVLDQVQRQLAALCFVAQPLPVLAVIGDCDELADVVQQSSRNRVLLCGAFGQDRRGDLSDERGVALELVDRESGYPRGCELADRLG